ncbi:MAG TPA: hemerythrin domain-containing protein [Bacteroidota bacterium]|nr:hemerythrin domain-containing protein [Bacteroidota bacterium]
MQGPVHRYLAADHDRLDDLFRQASADPRNIAMDAYGRFREGLLRHIGMEENVLLPEAQRRGGGVPLAVADRIRRDHGALAALMVPPPDAAIINTVRAILRVHNALEEQEGGLYQECELLAGDEAEALLQRLTAVSPPPLRAFNGGPGIMEATRRAVERAGYAMQEE